MEQDRYLDDVGVFEALSRNDDGKCSDLFFGMETDVTETKEVTATDVGSVYPETWEPMEMNDQDFTHHCLFDLPISSDEFMKIYELIMSRDTPSNLQIAQIQRVQNPFRWRRYETLRVEMKKKGACNETVLFHGTTHTSVRSIAQTGFNRCVYVILCSIDVDFDTCFLFSARTAEKMESFMVMEFISASIFHILLLGRTLFQIHRDFSILFYRKFLSGCLDSGSLV